MNKTEKLRIGIDLDDTITNSPRFFSLMTNAMKGVADIHIITNREQTEASRKNTEADLRELGIAYHHLAITGDKIQYIEQHAIQIYFDDMDENIVGLPASVTVFKIREEWNFDFDEMKWR